MDCSLHYGKSSGPFTHGLQMAGLTAQTVAILDRANTAVSATRILLAKTDNRSDGCSNTTTTATSKKDARPS